MYDNAWVSGNADWITIGPIGSRNDFATVLKSDSGLLVNCGCFSGTIEEFEKSVDKTHGDNQHGIAYKAMIAMAKARMCDEKQNR